MNNPTLLTEPEVAEMLKASERSVRRVRKSGALTHIRIGRLIRYRFEDVVAFVESAAVANDDVRPATLNSTKRSVCSRRGKIVGFLERNDGDAR